MALGDERVRLEMKRMELRASKENALRSALEFQHLLAKTADAHYQEAYKEGLENIEKNMHPLKLHIKDLKNGAEQLRAKISLLQG